MQGGRRAFAACLALAPGGEVLATLDGAVEGEILRAERGQNGFGYDSLFQPNGFTKTFAELSAAEKNALSHRAVAVAQLRDFLETAHLAD